MKHPANTIKYSTFQSTIYYTIKQAANPYEYKFFTQDNSQIWHSGLSPCPYEIVVLPNTVSSCYSCHRKLLDLERAFSTNLVIKHRDRCITVRSTTEELQKTADYQCTYYQVGKKHAVKKNSIFLSNLTVHISSASYKQLMQLFEVQRVFHFSHLNIEPQ